MEYEVEEVFLEMLRGDLRVKKARLEWGGDTRDRESVLLVA
jgi:hypothetical protein